jgi:ABC-type uncharacterized transport system permease subunit
MEIRIASLFTSLFASLFASLFTSLFVSLFASLFVSLFTSLFASDKAYTSPDNVYSGVLYVLCQVLSVAIYAHSSTFTRHSKNQPE